MFRTETTSISLFWGRMLSNWLKNPFAKIKRQLILNYFIQTQSLDFMKSGILPNINGYSALSITGDEFLLNLILISASAFSISIYEFCFSNISAIIVFTSLFWCFIASMSYEIFFIYLKNYLFHINFIITLIKYFQTFFIKTCAT